MGDFIQTNYGARSYNAFVKTGGSRQANAALGSFMAAALQAGIKGADPLGTAGNIFGGVTVAEAQMMMKQQSVRNMGQAESAGQTEDVNTVDAVEAPSLEQMLKAKYPGLAYHVFDASSSNWRTRNDYPHYLLYQQDIDTEAIENWKPSGPNPFYGSKDGKFIAPKEIKALANVPPGSKAVVIHPKVQERMEQDPEYAYEIMERIETWFAFDKARNEAIRPGSTADMSQAVAIGEDGSIVNAQASSCGGEITRSSDEMVRAYYLRLAKRAEFMRYLAKEQIKDSIQAADLAASMEAKAQLEEMMSDGRLLKIFGDKIAGTSTQTVLAMVRAEIRGV